LIEFDPASLKTINAGKCGTAEDFSAY